MNWVKRHAFWLSVPTILVALLFVDRYNVGKGNLENVGYLLTTYIVLGCIIKRFISLPHRNKEVK